MKKIGITGSSGFIGSHLLRWLTIRSEKFQVVEINRDDFSNNLLLDSKLKEIDILVHLAGKNRSSDYNEIEATNINLAKLIIKSLERVNSKPHVIISSSTQESQNNIYGKSKRISRELFVEWSNRSVASFTGLIIPNVFGPFSKPYYNTVVATFCHQLVNNQIPSVDIDNILHFIYIDELIHVILDIIENKKVGLTSIKARNNFWLENYADFDGDEKYKEEAKKENEYFDFIISFFRDIKKYFYVYKIQKWK